jgi:hypothetical protein
MEKHNLYVPIKPYAGKMTINLSLSLDGFAFSQLI